jgi:succinyl-diaminopimelate desuccinylase
MMDVSSLLQDLIRCASVTPEDAGAQDMIINALEPLGFETHDVTRGEIRNTYLRKGTSGPHLCFAGHTDVVPSGKEDDWTHPPFSGDIKDGKLYGRGAVDMKGNIAAFIIATEKFLNETPDFNGSISYLITGDEEARAVDGTIKVLEWMEQENQIPDVCLVGEPTNPKNIGDELKIGRRGSLTGRLTVKGTQGHTAYPHLSDNPLPKIIKLLDVLANYEFDTGSEFFPKTHLALTTIDVGNPATNVTPAEGTAVFNMRFNDLWDKHTLDAKLREILDSVGAPYELETRSNSPSFLTQPGAWSDTVSAAIQDITGKAPALTTSGGTSDARFIQNYCPVVEFGLINQTMHQTDEHTEVKHLDQLVEIYTNILKRYFA